MKHTIILAHPSLDSFNAAMASTYADAVRALGDEADVRDLYRMKFDPRLAADELPWAPSFSPHADVQAERLALADTGVFVFVYPLWFNAPPAMLKGYVDRVFGMGFGYEPGPGGNEPGLDGRKLVSLTSTGAPDHWVNQTGAVATLRHAFDDHLAAVCGLTVIDHINFGGIVPGIRPDAVATLLEAVRRLARQRVAEGAVG